MRSFIKTAGAHLHKWTNITSDKYSMTALMLKGQHCQGIGLSAELAAVKHKGRLHKNMTFKTEVYLVQGKLFLNCLLFSNHDIYLNYD